MKARLPRPALRRGVENAADGVDLILLDYRLPDADGLSVLKHVKDTSPDTLVIMLTARQHRAGGRGDRQGAHTSTAQFDEVALLVGKALETARRESERCGRARCNRMASTASSTPVR